MSDTPELPASARRVQDWLDAQGPGHRVVQLDESGRTAQEAADALGCQVAQIAKSLIFALNWPDPLPAGAQPPAGVDHQAVLILASGAHRVDETRVAQALAQAWSCLGLTLGKANARLVRDLTGYAIGGIPPVAHAVRLPVVMDESLFQWPELWAAAGTPHTVFKLQADTLQAWTGALVTAVATTESPSP
ncbi:YbaK/EbsC family protein [Amphibiibacter pelophylacis]|uniref:YbaK/EbsC family protein n=1 Tax=Amphibiibacter pelophylacis TaxID=1799477 RepID=A0ACC6P4G2_9BURK